MVMKIIVGITGASGIRLSYRLIEELYKHDNEVYTIVTDNAYKVAEAEEGLEVVDKINGFSKALYNERQMDSPLASASFLVDGMVIIPCSMNTIAKLAYGISDNLVLRAADNQIKMRNKLILVPRESPLSSTHLRNLYRLSKIDNIYIIFPLLTYYHKPSSIDDMENYTIGRIMDVLGIKHNLYRRWTGLAKFK